MAAGKLKMWNAGKILVATIALSALGVPASAENCHKFPEGPFRRECLDKKFPARIAKREACREEADQMNLTNLHGKRNKAKHNYVQGCMKR